MRNTEFTLPGHQFDNGVGDISAVLCHQESVFLSSSFFDYITYVGSIKRVGARYRFYIIKYD